LRHRGFPSPLLDWTESPLVAAYFAYYEDRKADRVAVNVYVEIPKVTTSLPANEIRLIGPNLKTDPRHFAQQARYTFAVRHEESDGKHWFCSHDDILDDKSQEHDQLYKITMPGSYAERHKALEELRISNINHFTLFQSEDALVRALAMKVKIFN
jgi:hypothetical protein